MSDTGPTGDCALNQRDCWLIRYAIPFPKRIRYRYPGGEWIEVEGETWSTVTTSGNYNLLPGVEYRVFWDATWFNGQPWSNTFNGGAPSFQIVRGNFQITRQCPFGWADGCQISFTSERGTISISFPQSTLVEIPFDRSGSNFWNVLTGTFRIVAVQRVSTGETILPQSTCRFRIFSATGAVLVDRTSEACPEVQEFPCTNDKAVIREIVLKPQDRPQVFSLFTTLRIRTETLSDRVCRIAELISAVQLPPSIYIQPVLRICSPVGCFVPPYIEYRCNGGCECTRCPDGTCFACEDNGFVCCYGENGQPLARFPLEQKCPDQEIC